MYRRSRHAVESVINFRALFLKLLTVTVSYLGNKINITRGHRLLTLNCVDQKREQERRARTRTRADIAVSRNDSRN